MSLDLYRPSLDECHGLDEDGLCELWTSLNGQPGASVEAHAAMNEWLLGMLQLLGQFDEDEAQRFCPGCGCDRIGNDPHAPRCPEEAYWARWEDVRD